VRIIANITYNNKTNQNFIRDIDGIPTILNCCIIDDLNPLLKEWASYAVRNLIISNEENQNYISQLNPIKIEDKVKQSMEAMGFDIDLDDKGKIRIKKKEPIIEEKEINNKNLDDFI